MKPEVLTDVSMLLELIEMKHNIKIRYLGGIKSGKPIASSSDLESILGRDLGLGKGSTLDLGLFEFCG